MGNFSEVLLLKTKCFRNVYIISFFKLITKAYVIGNISICIRLYMNKEISIKQYIILRSLQRFRMEWECSHAVGG